MEAVWQRYATVRMHRNGGLRNECTLCLNARTRERVRVRVYMRADTRCHESDARPSVVCRNSPIHVSLSAPVPGSLQSVQLYFYDPSQGFYSVDY